ncbi:MAG: hypothetical protein GY913_23610 [Proteobacteria bacterium]|nr:hypothetical protein [Pseudomonadota bacterium]MCP4919901.1 hypothetical protein [Pseudomonadota bacterium]
MFAFLLACAATDPTLDQVLTDLDGEDVSLEWEGQVTTGPWGIPPETQVDVLVEGEFLGTWTTRPVDTTGLVPLQVTHRAADADIDHVRFISVMTLHEGAVAVMTDTQGRTVWRQDLDTREFVKGVAVDTANQRIYAALPSNTIEEGGEIRVMSPTGPMERLVTDCALHHGIALGPDGDLLGLGWEIEPIGAEDVLFDTVERIDVETGECTTLLRLQDHLPWPTESAVSSLSPGLYDGDVRAYGYANGLSYDPSSGLASTSVPMVTPGLLVSDLADTSTFLTSSDDLYDEPHHGWANAHGEVLVYNRRNADEGTTIDALSLDGERVGRYRLQDATGEAAYNSHLGTAFPVDRELGVEGGLIAGYHPFAASTYELTEDPFDPSGTPGTSRRLLQLQSADPAVSVVGGFMEAFSIDTLNGG